MKFKIITLFPKIFDALNEYSIIGRAIASNLIEIEAIDLRDFGLGKRKTVDGTPYGGGAGMVLRPDVMDEAISSTVSKQPYVIALSPKGEKFTQAMAQELSKKKEIILVCGHYEGFDQRTLDGADRIVSIGDYVVTGGEIPAMILIDAISRLKKGVLGNELSPIHESHSVAGKTEAPQYTKPFEFKGQTVPEVLISGNHKEIDKWRKEHSIDIVCDN